MLVINVLACVVLIVAAVRSQDCECDKNIQKYYKELGCKPKNDEASCCPAEFDCKAVLSTRAPEKCHLNGVSYEPKDKITSEQAGSPCVPTCICQKFGPQASFHCAHNDCPELFQDRLPDNCVRLYAHGKCCSTGTHCDNATSNASPPSKPKTCAYNGQTYVVGQKFYPKERPCKQCICSNQFDGTLNGPWCQDISCGIELHYGAKILDGCAPIYFGTNGCCPIGWRCPTSTDTVVPSAAKKSKTTTIGKCTFGNLSLNVNDKLSKEKNCVDCSCSLPPHVSCVQKGYC